MRNPARSTSLGEFWGRRWNTAFHELANHYAFKALRPSVGMIGATLTTFLASGLVHELVITVPAGGGYGLPTGYFVVQGIGLASERSALGRSLGLGRGWRGWMFTAVVAAGPAFWLFPPPFMHNVVIALCLVSFSLLTFVFAETLASGTTLARALCVFFALFWTLRLVV